MNTSATIKQQSTPGAKKQTGRYSYYPWIVVALLWGVALLNYLDRQMLATMRPSMQAAIPELQSATNFGYLMAIFLWIYAVVSPFSGMIADRLNRKWLIVLSLGVWSGVTLLMGYATSFQQLYWLRALMGVSEALYIPAGLSLIADYHSDRTRSLAIGIHMTGLYLGQALGGFGATWAARYSWSATFHSFGAVGLGYALLLLLFLKEHKKADSDYREVSSHTLRHGLRSLLSRTSFWILMLCFAISSLPGWATKNWLPTLFAQNLHMDMAEAGPLTTITIAGASFLGVVAGGMLSDRWVQKNIRGRVFTSALGLLLTIPALLFMGFGHSLLYVVGAGILFGLGYGMFDANNMPILCQLVPPQVRATAYGLMNLCGVLAGALVTGLLGKSTDAGNLGKSFALLGVLVLAALLLEFYFLRPGNKDVSENPNKTH